MKNLILLSLFAVMTSCNTDNNNGDSETSSASSTNTTEVQQTNFDASCLIGNIKNFPSIISDEKMFEITGKTNEGLTQNYVKALKGIYQYNWKGNTGRKMTLVNDMIVDVKDKVAIIINSTNTDVESFKKGYYPVETDVNNEQGVQLKKEVELALKGESSNKDMNENVIKLRETGLSDEEIIKTYTGFTDLAAKTSAQKVIVSGVGEAAVWNRNDHELVTNADNMTFVVVVTLNEDDEEDLEIAKTIVNIILGGC